MSLFFEPSADSPPPLLPPPPLVCPTSTTSTKASDDDISSVGSLQYDFKTIRDATDNFSAANKLGEGGFCIVYKAWKNWTEGTITDIGKNWTEGTITDMIDPLLAGTCIDEIMTCIRLGLLCVQENVASRPTMASIVLMLNSNSFTLPVPSAPGFLLQSKSSHSILILQKGRTIANLRAFISRN